MAAQNTGKITQVIGAVLDIRFDKGVLPEINDAVEIRRKDGSTLVAELSLIHIFRFRIISTVNSSDERAETA